MSLAMVCPSGACRRCATFLPLRIAVVCAALVAMGIETATAVEFTLGPKEVLYSASQRKKKKLGTWPDGNLGVVPVGDGTYDFYGANGGNPVKTTGSLSDPAWFKKSVSISGIPKKAFDYVAGGPVYEDPESGARLMIYHAERHGKTSKNFYSMLGMAVSTDASGLRFRDLGIIVEPNLPSGRTEVGGGSFAVFDDYLNVYYRDWNMDGSATHLAVARAPLAEVINNALNEHGTPFTKYYNGSWSEPGIGGMATPLEIGNPSNDWVSVSYNDYLDQLVMVSSQWTPAKQDLYLATSPDGVNWSPRQALVTDPGEQFYPTLIGTGADPTHSGQSFYVYYTDSNRGAWNRWKDAHLVRREINLEPFVPVVPIDPPALPDPPPSEWTSVAAYAADFQTGAPATGWQYVWNPTGNLGDAAAFAPLAWSNSDQVYNTTGAATRAAGPISHNDDFLALAANGGHPGNPDFAAIAGYTIQEHDGAGFYRLFDSSIQKADNTTSYNEDGLQVFVYVNDAQLGAAQSVSTSGHLASFDRNLGDLNVGDTVWVVVDALGSQFYDSFANFDFALQKASPSLVASGASMHMMQLFSAVTIPEPNAVLLALVAIGTGCLSRPIRRTR